MKKSTFKALIKEGNFRELFILEMGWNNYDGNSELPPIIIDETEYEFRTVAERNGFQILECNVDEIPNASLCRRIDVKLRPNAQDYIAIYKKGGTEHHQWVTPVRKVDKRDIVTIEYASAEKADFLYEKIEGLSFDLMEETTIVDVKQRIQETFAVNSEKITKDFYKGFRKEHNAFAGFITGIEDHIHDKENRNKQWYASVMLNRLMFCYFIQKKGFLDGDIDYLNHKLHQCQEQRGENKFFRSFYKEFLMHLFQDGLNDPSRPEDFEEQFGRIPYLNGGMFDLHQIERDYEDIDIEDEAFERLFKFFDQWRWHLDTRISASGKDINPDVLGYIFEQYINDRAKMGAYYTKEDITEYIGRNCIVPFLLNKVSKSTQEMQNLFSTTGKVWQWLQNSGDRYLFDAVKHGYTLRWREQIPPEIAYGLDTTLPNLLERRSKWNSRTPESWGLPTEIWRETIERLQRCESIIEKIETGEIHEINDFITYNLNIRLFTQDLLEQTSNTRLIRNFYHALQEVTILDPTCGSGAFLFAAMNILEPLYETCISRMEEYHSENEHLFKDELNEITAKYRSNIQYFIYKSIILRNLYGVDIMAEAVEIAKLRLFLKMVAVVEVDKKAPNLGLDPLPDIDFNIRCGNTLIGYATEEEVIKGHSEDLFTAVEFSSKIKEEMQKVAMAYNAFRQIQLTQQEDMRDFWNAKQELQSRLTSFNEQLNRQLFSQTDMGTGSNYDDWLASHQPFHWIAEFYEIISGNGGFDVIIGNPPYVVNSKRKVQYEIRGYQTQKCSNLYAYIFERSFIIGHCKIGLIVQLSSIGTDAMSPLQQYLLSNSSLVHYGSFPERPKQLFEGACIALSIIQCEKGKDKVKLFGSGISRINNISRDILFNKINYISVPLNSFIPSLSLYPKYSQSIEVEIYSKFATNKAIQGYISNSTTSNILAYRTAGGRYWKLFIDRPFATISTSNKTQYLTVSSYLLVAVLNSNLFWWFYSNFFDLYNLKDYMIFNFRFSAPKASIQTRLEALGRKLMQSYEANKVINKQSIKSKQAESIFESFNPGLSKPIIDEIDKVLAEHYGFTEEELDFIINYDIKYRMGDELNSDE